MSSNGHQASWNPLPINFTLLPLLAMAIHFHSNKPYYFKMQRDNAADYVIPFVEEALPIVAGMHVLEIGCAEGGVLQAFLERGCYGVGVELSESRAKQAAEFLDAYIVQGKAEIHSKNIYDPAFASEFP